MLEHFPHSVNALAFLLKIRVNIKIEGSADIGMTQQDADRLVVAFAFDAAGGETMPQSMKTHFGKAKLLLELIEIAAVCAWLRGCGGVGEDVKVSADNLLQRAYQSQQVARHRNLSD